MDSRDCVVALCCLFSLCGICARIPTLLVTDPSHRAPLCLLCPIHCVNESQIWLVLRNPKVKSKRASIVVVGVACSMLLLWAGWVYGKFPINWYKHVDVFTWVGNTFACFIISGFWMVL